MASSVMTEGILTIAVVIAASAAAAMFIQSSYQLNYSQSIAFQGAKEIVSTSIKVVFATNVSEFQVKAWVKNIGRTDIDSASLSRFDVFFGRRESPTLVLHRDSAPGWTFVIANDFDSDGRLDPGETLEVIITTDYALMPGDYCLRINTQNGVIDTYYFSM